MKKSERLEKIRTAGQAAGRKIAKINHAASAGNARDNPGLSIDARMSVLPPFC